MFIVTSSTLAVFLCVVTMLCWGNTQKLAGKSWRYELFYWDYIVGILLFSLVVGLTLGSNGEGGRAFLTDLGQLDATRAGSAILGGIIFNAANILLTAAVSISGLAIAWPIGLGIALVLGVFLNYILAPNGNPALLALGVALVLGSVICNGVASGKNSKTSGRGISKNGLTLTIVSGLLMGISYIFCFHYVASNVSEIYTNLNGNAAFRFGGKFGGKNRKKLYLPKTGGKVSLVHYFTLIMSSEKSTML